jgi:hypothetical protein
MNKLAGFPQKLLLLTSVLLISVGCRDWEYENIETYQTDSFTEISEHMKEVFLQQDESGVYWTLTLSDSFGNIDYWILRSIDGDNWQYYYTDVAWFFERKILFEVEKGNAIIESFKRLQGWGSGYRSLCRMKRFECSVRDLMRDSDGDGLSDLAESRFCTNPRCSDTDHDGKRDGADNNPRVTQPDSLTEEQVIENLFVEEWVGNPATRRLIFIVEDSVQRQEYRPEGCVFITLTSYEESEMRQRYPQGPETVSMDTEVAGDSAAVFFTSYVAMLGACGGYASFLKENGMWRFVELVIRWIADSNEDGDRLNRLAVLQRTGLMRS